MKTFYSYVRVSTTRQGQIGTSLAEQRDAINRHAQRHELTISEEFEEQETAAKQGRPVFARMLKALKSRQAAGVVMHKIDRSARNLRDWADLGELIDSGVEVHFANEGLDLQSRGGRLSADIQAVVAADYIRNLREEALKGFYGRLKQGVYPMPAPLGYADCGAGKPKQPHPVKAPLVRQAFEMYATTKWSLQALTQELHDLGLRNRRGGRVTDSTLSDLFHNPFYTGVIRMKGSGEIFKGGHPPIITRSLYDRVQAVLSGKTADAKHRHLFLFRKQLTCGRCGSTLIGERQKHHHYYRCHERTCSQKTIREELIEDAFLDVLRKLRFSERENDSFRREIESMRGLEDAVNEARMKALQLQQDQINSRMARLADAYLDGVFDHQTYANKKSSLIMEEAAIQENLQNKEGMSGTIRYVNGFLEHANNAYISYKSGIFDEKREMVKIVTSNLIVEGKSVLVKPYFPFQLVAERQTISDGGAKRDEARTVRLLTSQLINYFRQKNLTLKQILNT